MILTSAFLSWTSEDANTTSFANYANEGKNFLMTPLLLFALLVVLHRYKRSKQAPGLELYKYAMFGLFGYLFLFSPINVESIAKADGYVVSASNDDDLSGINGYYNAQFSAGIVAYVGIGLAFVTMFSPLETAKRSSHGENWLFATAGLTVIGSVLLLDAKTKYNSGFGTDLPIRTPLYLTSTASLLSVLLLAESVYSGTPQFANCVMIVASLVTIWSIGLMIAIHSAWVESYGGLGKLWAGFILCWSV